MGNFYGYPHQEYVRISHEDWREIQQQMVTLNTKLATKNQVRFGIVGLAIAGTLVSVFAILAGVGLILTATGHDRPVDQPLPGTGQSWDPNPTATGSNPATATPGASTVPSHAAVAATRTAHATVVNSAGKTCVVTAGGKRYCGTPAPSRSGKACVVYPSGRTYCGTAV